MNTVRMTVIHADDQMVLLVGEAQEPQKDGFTGARLELHFNDSDSGVPLVTGQIVTLALTPTIEQESVARIQPDDSGQPDRIEYLNPATGEWKAED